ncbi:MAG TPA: response regulator transcription factor [Candidatus Aquilonibacter sp.]|nr:response regulator transcription factor [Candidatus Aquilonibacter sp.]
MSRVLVVEDETHLADGLRFNLEAEGHSVEIVADGETAVTRLARRRESFDAVVLDVMLPFRDGFQVVASMRAAKNYAPVLMLTARSRPEDVLRGFAAGADDYLPKPFELPIFLARLQGLLRRSAWLRESGPHAQCGEHQGDQQVDDGETSDVYAFDGKIIDFGTLELRSGDTIIHLTLMEAKLLRHLIENRGKVVTRKSILEDVWGLHEDTDTRAIDNFIVRLRRYLEEDPSNPQRLLTVRGVGYRFVIPEQSPPRSHQRKA